MFGAYQAGVWKRIATLFRPDVVIGTSAGALNAWAIASRCSPEDLIARWLDPRLGSMLRLKMLGPLHRFFAEHRIWLQEFRIGGICGRRRLSSV